MELNVIDYSSPYYPQVIDLRNRILRIPLGLNLADENLADEKDQCIIIMTKGEEVLACLMLQQQDEKHVKLRQMAVDNHQQRKGIGTMLIEYAENFCLLNDYHLIELHARKEALQFYQRLGYQSVGDEFTEVGIPHSKMVKDLIAYRRAHENTVTK